jgi:hypothetical protein
MIKYIVKDGKMGVLSLINILVGMIMMISSPWFIDGLDMTKEFCLLDFSGLVLIRSSLLYLSFTGQGLFFMIILENVVKKFLKSKVFKIIVSIFFLIGLGFIIDYLGFELIIQAHAMGKENPYDVMIKVRKDLEQKCTKEGFVSIPRAGWSPYYKSLGEESKGLAGYPCTEHANIYDLNNNKMLTLTHDSKRGIFLTPNDFNGNLKSQYLGIPAVNCLDVLVPQNDALFFLEKFKIVLEKEFMASEVIIDLESLDIVNFFLKNSEKNSRVKFKEIYDELLRVNKLSLTMEGHLLNLQKDIGEEKGMQGTVDQVKNINIYFRKNRDTIVDLCRSDKYKVYNVDANHRVLNFGSKCLKKRM